MTCLTKILVRAMATLKGGTGTLAQVFEAVCAIESDVGKALTTNDVVTAVQEARAAGLVTVKYDYATRSDIITLCEGQK
jgi:hypothetical protein